MPAKMARSDPLPPFGASTVMAVVRGRQAVLPERGKSAKFTRTGSHLGNLG
jgi:hypothetical protein